jgi:hypothetical protein
MDLSLEGRGLDLSGLAYRSVAEFCERGNDPLGSITRAEFLDQMRQY